MSNPFRYLCFCCRDQSKKCLKKVEILKPINDYPERKYPSNKIMTAPTRLIPARRMAAETLPSIVAAHKPFFIRHRKDVRFSTGLLQKIERY